MKKLLHILKRLLIINYALLITSCSVSKQIAKSADKILLQDSSISTGHIGISIYEPATDSYWYNYDATKYFVPASNVKLFTCYAGMKYLGDSLVGITYQDFDTAILINPTGDPTFLHDDFAKQPVLDFLRSQQKNIFINDANWKDEALGKGWAWDDYNDSYMAERSPFPILGNVVKFTNGMLNRPSFFLEKRTLVDSLIRGRMFDLNIIEAPVPNYTLKRNKERNDFEYVETKVALLKQEIPFLTDTIKTVRAILKKDYAINILPANNERISKFKIQNLKLLHSQPTDSLLKPMMHRSDNFFAEQTLLMVSNEHLGYMNDEAIIDTLLKTDFKDVPQKPKWVDGCGLSRYNLFTPQSFIYILKKLKTDFGMERLKNILPTGGEGTLKNYYLKDSSFIYAKTGSLSNNVSLCGFLITKKNKLLIFSILVNNFKDDSTPVRIAIEQFIENIREKY